jgi:hypothetical protein
MMMLLKGLRAKIYEDSRTSGACGMLLLIGGN